MNPCPHCGRPMREQLGAAQRAVIAKYAQRLAEEGCALEFSWELDTDDTIVAWLTGADGVRKPLVGNRSVRQLRLMLEAMTRLDLSPAALRAAANLVGDSRNPQG